MQRTVTVNSRVWHGSLLTGLSLIVLVWLVFNGLTSVVGLELLFGSWRGTGNWWVLLVGLAFPFTDVLALGLHVASEYFTDENGEPLISRENMAFVWGTWAVTALTDSFLSVYFLDERLYQSVQRSAHYTATFASDTILAYIPWVGALMTYVLTLALIYMLRDAFGRAIGGLIGGGGYRPGPVRSARNPRGRSKQGSQEFRRKTGDPYIKQGTGRRPPEKAFRPPEPNYSVEKALAEMARTRQSGRGDVK